MSSAEHPVNKPHQTQQVTTLFDLISALQEHSEPDNDAEITDALIQLCKAGHLRFLSPRENELPGNSQIGAA